MIKDGFIRSMLNHKFEYLAFFAILSAFVFLRFYQLEQRMQFSWDQVDNAWVSKNLIVNHVLPIYGMPVNQGSGFNIGPLYYYIIAGVYYLSNLDPVGAGIFAGLTSFITIIAIFIVVKEIFSARVAIFGSLIYLFSNYIIIFDRISWPVNFIPLISLLLFFFLFKAITDNKKYLLFVACVLGFSFHIHFTSVLYLIILLFCLPYFINKKSLIYGFFSFFIFGIWISPILIADIFIKSQSRNLAEFFKNTFHGFHLRRMMQIAGDAFIEFPGIAGEGISKYAYLFIPFFFTVYFYINKKKFLGFIMSETFPTIKRVKSLINQKEFVIIYLICLWFTIPWIALSTYKGNISNYYFSLTRPIAIMVMAYVLSNLFYLKGVMPKLLVSAFLVLFIYLNLKSFFTYRTQGLAYYKKNVKTEVAKGIKNQFLYGAPESYLHYYYERSIK